MAKLSLNPAPRLYVSEGTATHLKDKLHSPFLKNMADQVLKDAGRLTRAKPLEEGSGPSYQSVTRPIDTHLQCLTTAWALTKKPAYRKAAIRHMANLATFNHISCEARVNTPPEKEMPFCLSYGELSQTIGLMYDLFRPAMTSEEQQAFFAVLDKFLMREAVKCLDTPPWWANKEWSNWNGVCAGGMGIMALAFYDDLPDARKLIPFVEKSLGEYFKSFIDNDGGCLEGTGYWNYGLNYAMRYLLSWENATGKKHPALKIKEFKKALYFPLDFTGISFGDNDGWGPTAFYFLLAQRLNQHHAALNAATYLSENRPSPTRDPKSKNATGGELLFAADAIPTAAEIDRLKTEHTAQKVPVARIYQGMDWAALADDEAFPSLRMAVRGGSSAITGHGMIDLLSIRCRVNGELMITDQQDGSYMGTTFTKRGHELYGRSPASKSSLFVDGLGCNTNVSCDTTEIVEAKGLLGIRIDASSIYLPRWKDKRIGRLVLMVENAYWLVVDHVLGAHEVDTHWVESRFHTMAETRKGKNWVRLKSGNQRMTMTFAALGEGVMQESAGMPAQPTVPRTTIFRWMGTTSAQDNLQVAALNPGSGKLRIKLGKEKNGNYTIEVTKPGGTARVIRLTEQLDLV